MTQPVNFEDRITALENIEAIKKLISRYCNSLDKKLWDEVTSCFSEDAIVDYGPAKRFEGRKVIRAHFDEVGRTMGKSVARIHQCHNHEIEITGKGKAVGIWQLFHYRIDLQSNRGRRLGGIFYDEYSKEKGEWKIQHLRHVQIFREVFDR